MNYSNGLDAPLHASTASTASFHRLSLKYSKISFFRPIGGKLIPVNTCLTNKGCKILSEIIAKQAAVTPPGLTAKLVGAEQIVPWRKRRRRWVWTKKVEKSRKRGKARVVGAKSVVSGDTGIAQDQTGKPTSAGCQKSLALLGKSYFTNWKYEGTLNKMFRAKSMVSGDTEITQGQAAGC